MNRRDWLKGFAQRIHLAMGDESPREFSRRTGIAEGSLSKYRNALSSPRAEKVTTLALALSVDATWLATGEGSMRTAAPPAVPEPRPPMNDAQLRTRAALSRVVAAGRAGEITFRPEASR